MFEVSPDLLIVDEDKARAEKVCAYLLDAGYKARRCLGSLSIDASSPKPSVSESPASQSGYESLVSEQSLILCHLSALASIAASDRNDVDPLPTIVYAESPSADQVVEAMRRGAIDFVITDLSDATPANLSEFGGAIERALNAREDVDQVRQVHQLNSDLKRHLRALELDQSAGRVVQRKLMPESPAELAGIRIEFQVLPSLYLSGDAIDFGLFGSRYVAFYLLDVSGHSAASAFIGIWVKQIVRGFFKGVGSKGARKPLNEYVPELMSHINEQLIDADIGQHLTAFVGVIDTHTMELSYVVAGHLPLPILIHEPGYKVTDIVGAGKPLGIFPGTKWKPSSLMLPEHFFMIVCSDGVLELLPQADLISKEQGLKSLIQTQQPTSLADLEISLLDHRKAPLPDDVALLVLSKGASD